MFLGRAALVGDYFLFEFPIPEIRNCLIGKSYFGEIACMFVVFRTLGTYAEEKSVGIIVLIQAGHAPYLSIFGEIAAYLFTVRGNSHIYERSGNRLVVVVV